MTYSNTYHISSYSINHKLALSIDKLFMFMQETALQHAASHHFGWHDLKAQQQLWVLSKMEVDILRFPLWNESIQVCTWAKNAELLSAYRDFCITDAENHTIATATSAWLILDAATHKPLSMAGYEQHFPTCPQQAMEGKPCRISMPNDLPATISEERQVYASDIDINCHANNTQYIRWAMDAIPWAYAQNHHLCHIGINFNSEALCEDKFIVRTAQKENTFTQQIVRTADNKILAHVCSSWQKDI